MCGCERPTAAVPPHVPPRSHLELPLLPAAHRKQMSKAATDKKQPLIWSRGPEAAPPAFCLQQILYPHQGQLQALLVLSWCFSLLSCSSCSTEVSKGLSSSPKPSNRDWLLQGKDMVKRVGLGSGTCQMPVLAPRILPQSTGAEEDVAVVDPAVVVHPGDQPGLRERSEGTVPPPPRPSGPAGRRPEGSSGTAGQCREGGCLEPWSRSRVLPWGKGSSH